MLISRAGVASLFSVVLALAAGASSARAGGFELVGQGAQSLARGGATFARADDPMVLAHNPAGLAELRGSQLLLNLNVALFDACVDPAGYYGWGVYPPSARSRFIDPDTGREQVVPLGEIDRSDGRERVAARDYYRDLYDTVCLEQNVTPIPQLAWTMRLTEGLGIGFGFLFPAAVPSGRWGGENGIIRGDDGKLRPAATRYQMLRASNLGVFPTLGVGYRLLDWLRVGVAFEWGVFAINNETMSASLGGTTPANDIVAHVKAQDWFVPALTSSIHLVPDEAIDVVLGFRWSADIDAKGTADLTTGLFDPVFAPHTNVGIDITSIEQKMPWKLRFGIRYADRLLPRPTGTGSDESDLSSGGTIHDALEHEWWDIELDVEYQMNGRNQQQRVDFAKDQVARFDPVLGLMPGVRAPTADVPKRVVIEKHWQDQFSVRAGGSYNILPGVLGLSTGVHYETLGVDPDYMQIDFWPMTRIGIHGGVTVRLSNAIDLVFAYAHVFQETLIVQPPPHLERNDAYAIFESTDGRFLESIDKTVGVEIKRGTGRGVEVLDAASQGSADGTARVRQVVSQVLPGQPPYITNAGRYRSNLDLLAVGVNVHF
jgi:long-chain fatty acid transport protein